MTDSFRVVFHDIWHDLKFCSLLPPNPLNRKTGLFLLCETFMYCLLPFGNSATCSVLLPLKHFDKN